MEDAIASAIGRCLSKIRAQTFNGALFATNSNSDFVPMDVLVFLFPSTFFQLKKKKEIGQFLSIMLAYPENIHLNQPNQLEVSSNYAGLILIRLRGEIVQGDDIGTKT